jgi:hypothetical protein
MSKKPEEIPEEEFDEEMEEMDEDGQDGFDLVDALGQMLCTEDGETLATVMSAMKDSTEKIATQLELQNKILVKIFGALKPS